MKKKILMAVAFPIIIILVLAGIAFASGYQFWSGQANVTVLEAMDVDMVYKSGGSWDGGTNTWTITGLKAGEFREIEFDLTNTASSGTLLVTPIVSPDAWPGFDLEWSGDIIDDAGELDAGDTKDAMLTITAEGDVSEGTGYVFTITFERDTYVP